MDGSTETSGRDERGRFVPGQSGNPAGKTPGTRNRATVLRAALDDGEDMALARVLLDKALAGDVVTARFLFGRLEPAPRERPIALDLPEGLTGMGGVVAAFNAAVTALASGEVTPEEAVKIGRFLEMRFKVLQAVQLERNLTRYSDSPPIPGEGSGGARRGADDKAQDEPDEGEEEDDWRDDDDDEEEALSLDTNIPSPQRGEGGAPCVSTGRVRGWHRGTDLTETGAALTLRHLSVSRRALTPSLSPLGGGGHGEGTGPRGERISAAALRGADAFVPLRGLRALRGSSVSQPRLHLHSAYISRSPAALAARLHATTTPFPQMPAKSSPYSSQTRPFL